jgi:uncharacterized delta-60 repeat protein
MRCFRVAGTLLAGLLFVALTALPAVAAAGDLDHSFSFDGKVTTSVAHSHGIVDIAVQPDRKIVALGDSGKRFVVIRYLLTGGKDPSFGGGDGIVSFGFGSPDFTEPGGIALSPVDQFIVVAGRAAYSNGHEDMVVARLTPAGVLDDTFSNDGRTHATNADFSAGANDVTVESDGSVVATGFGDSDLGVARFLSTGVPDPGFGNGGFTQTHLGLIEEGFGVAEDSLGRIVVVGRRLDASQPESRRSDFIVARYTTGGHLDHAFSTNGWRTSDFLNQDQANDVAIIGSNRIVAVGTADDPGSHSTFAMAKYKTDGTNDTSFGGGDGKVSTQIGVHAHNRSGAQAVAVQGDGKLVLVGHVFNPSTLRDFFALARYSTNGALDNSFGGNGKVATAFHLDASAFGAGIDALGRIVAGGGEFPSGNQSDPWALARYAA